MFFCALSAAAVLARGGVFPAGLLALPLAFLACAPDGAPASTALDEATAAGFAFVLSTEEGAAPTEPLLPLVAEIIFRACRPRATAWILVAAASSLFILATATSDAVLSNRDTHAYEYVCVCIDVQRQASDSYRSS